jgi:hypothetical protein
LPYTADLRDVMCTRSNERSDPESGSSKAPARGARARQIGVEAATDHAFLHEMPPPKGENVRVNKLAKRLLPNLS